MGHESCEQCKEKKEHSTPSCCSTTQQTPWYKQRLTIILIVTFILLGSSYFVPQLTAFQHAFFEYLQNIWWALIIGFLLGGIIDQFIPSSYIQKYLSQHRKRTIVYSIIFGFLMSACSHGILAIAIELYKKGANTANVIAFLLAAPWANLPITVLLFSFFGVKALFVVFSALLIALITGLIYQILESRGIVECQYCQGGRKHPDLLGFSIRKDIKKRVHQYTFSFSQIQKDFLGSLKASWSLTKMLLWWILVGMLAASLIRAFVPQDIFITYLGPTLLGLFVTLLFATIIEVCSEGSAPLAFEIYNQTQAFGNSFVFLMAGVATDYTEIGLIWQNIGKRAALFLPLITVPQIVLLGYLYNLLL